MGKTGPWRRVVIRTRNGHQTPILTSLGGEIGPARVVCLMLARWRQENFFRYMCLNHGIDALISYAVGEAREVMVPNPEHKRVTKAIAERRREAATLKAILGEAVLDEPRSSTTSALEIKISKADAVARLRALEAEIEQLLSSRSACPKQVPLSESGMTREAIDREAKDIVDRIKICAYNAEEWLLERLRRHYNDPKDIRDLLRSFADLPGEIRTTSTGMEVTLDPPDTPKHRRALEGLCADLTAEGVTYPGTAVPVSYRVAAVHNARAAA